MKSTLIKLWKDESGQGTAEYVLILVGVVAVGFLFKDKIKGIVSDKMTSLGGKIQGFGPE